MFSRAMRELNRLAADLAVPYRADLESWILAIIAEARRRLGLPK